MGTAMLVAAVHAAAAAVAAGGTVHAVPPRMFPIADLPMTAVAAWSAHRCGDGAPAVGSAIAAAAAIDDACVRLVVRDRASYRPGIDRRLASGGDGGDSGGWRLARAVLPGLEGLQGLVGTGGFGLGLGSELALARGARMTLHLNAPHDTRIAGSAFVPETTVLARCDACWVASDAIGEGVAPSARRMPPSASAR